MEVLKKNNLINRTKPSFIVKFLIVITGLVDLTALAQQQAYSGEDNMRDIFVSGGYGALFGATMGTAILPFLSGSPINNLRVVAGGASIGFMMGSAYGLYNASKLQNNSYFNYVPENDDNYFYSMPPTMPGQGYVSPKKQEENIAKKRGLPRAGALVVGEGSNIGFAFPVFWIGQNQFGLVLASLRF